MKSLSSIDWLAGYKTGVQLMTTETEHHAAKSGIAEGATSHHRASERQPAPDQKKVRLARQE